MDLDLRHLRHARALAEHGHFGRAARTLRLTQPALSRSIAQLERQVGAKLFERGSRGIEPTDMGRLLLDRAAELLARATDLGREMQSLQGRGAGALRVGAGTYPAGMLVGDAVAALLKQRPDVQVDLIVDNVLNLMPMLRRRELDVVIGDVTDVAKDPELHVTPLAARQGYFVCRAGHPLLARAVPTLTDVLAYPLIATSRMISRRLAPMIAAARQSGSPLPTAPAVTCESLEMMKTIARGSDGIALLPLNVIEKEVTDGTLVPLPLVEPTMRGDFGIIRLEHRTPPPSAEAFTTLLLAADAEVSRVITAMGKRLPGAHPPRRSARKAR